MPGRTLTTSMNSDTKWPPIIGQTHTGFLDPLPDLYLPGIGYTVVCTHTRGDQVGHLMGTCTLLSSTIGSEKHGPLFKHITAFS